MINTNLRSREPEVPKQVQALNLDLLTALLSERQVVSQGRIISPRVHSILMRS